MMTFMNKLTLLNGRNVISVMTIPILFNSTEWLVVSITDCNEYTHTLDHYHIYNHRYTRRNIHRHTHKHTYRQIHS